MFCRYGVDTSYILLGIAEDYGLFREMEIETMVATVAKWGNSLAVRIPQHLAKEMHLLEGAEIDLGVVDGALVIKPRRRKRYSLDELIEGITPENLHAEVDDGRAVGREIW